MKRSEINSLLRRGAAFFRHMRFPLPPFAFYSLSQWRKIGKRGSEIVDLGLGWDITDFGTGEFEKCGLLLFTLRNGKSKDRKYVKPYAEKAMIVEPDQVTPMHFHWFKMEDIINRGGGRLVMELHWATDDDRLSKRQVAVSIDGIQRSFKPGEKAVLKPGEGICLPPRLYHTFRAEGKRTFVAEVSRVNDDTRDNRFLFPTGRFPAIEEDEAPEFLLCGDYRKFL
jgi:D-lyxose ketol-isomerase